MSAQKSKVAQKKAVGYEADVEIKSGTAFTRNIFTFKREDRDAALKFKAWLIKGKYQIIFDNTDSKSPLCDKYKITIFVKLNASN